MRPPGCGRGFPNRNSPTDVSSGANPAPAGQRVQIPPQDRQTALNLDRNVGVEHLVAVFSAARWPELEAALDKAARADAKDASVTAALDLTRGVGEERPIDPENKQSVAARISGEDASLCLEGRQQAAAGSFLIVSRWFRHIDPPDR